MKSVHVMWLTSHLFLWQGANIWGEYFKNSGPPNKRKPHLISSLDFLLLIPCFKQGHDVLEMVLHLLQSAPFKVALEFVAFT